MTYAETILPEFDMEMANTRKVLERIADDKFEWRAAPKCNTLGWNANHLAEIPDWGTVTLTTDTWDFAPPGGERYQSPKFTTTKEVLEFFDKGVVKARQALAAVKDEAMGKNWSLLNAGAAILTMPRAAVMRGFVMSHMIHHRAHVCAYLRILGIPVPGMYGPSGDE